uniref:Rieske domain-containing protein n=1 Tax=Amazona collaria TaxID=241587 RepID=A0A8B9FYW1_9PSIT
MGVRGQGHRLPPLLCPHRLREVLVAGYPVLLVRNKKEFSALSSRCPHYGAPLSKGSPGSRERLRCPWHGACFNIRTGDIEEYPSLDCLHCFKVTVEDGKVFVTAKRKVWTLPAGTTHKQHLGVGSISAFPVSSLVGVAALVCAETLRQMGFTGRVIMATKEKHVPYDKSKLSKVSDQGHREVSASFLPQAVAVDFQKQKVHFMDGSSQKYNQLLIATGCQPSLLKVPGADLQNVCVLQTPEDSSKILELATGKNLVIIGASFIGMEAAAFLSDKAAAISVVEKQEFPFQRVLGPQVGAVTMKMLQNKGVKFYMQAELRQGSSLPLRTFAALILAPLPAGTFPSSAFLKGTSIARDASGAILVDLHMQTNIPNVFAAGDVASFPVALLNGERCSIHHQQVAEVHGHTAALNMLKKEKQLHTIPFFWTTMFGKSIRYAGRGAAAALGYVHWRDPRSAFSFREGVVSAAASLSCDPMVALIAEALYTGKQISKEEAE